MGFFDEQLAEGNKVIDNDTKITTMLLYFSEQEMKEFKQLCKAAMKAEIPNYQSRGNVSDLLLKMLRDRYGN